MIRFEVFREGAWKWNRLQRRCVSPPSWRSPCPANALPTRPGRQSRHRH